MTKKITLEFLESAPMPDIKEENIITAPKSLVRYPNATIITLFIATISLFLLTPSGPHFFLAIQAFWIILSIDDREEQRKGFFQAIDQIIKMSQKH